MPDLPIRPATSDDLPALLALYQQIDDGYGMLSLERLQEIFESMRRYPDYKIYVAVDRDKMVGTFALLIAEATGARCAPIGVVEDVVVDSDVRGKGVGKSMMEFARERCRDSGCYKMMLSSNLKRTDAHRFYESIGFEKHGYSFQVTP